MLTGRANARLYYLSTHAEYMRPGFIHHKNIYKLLNTGAI